MPEGKKKNRFERIYDKLSDEEKKYIADLPDVPVDKRDKRRVEILTFFVNPLEKLPEEEREKIEYSPKEIREILRKYIETPAEITIDEGYFLRKYPDLAKEANKIDPIFHNIIAKLSDSELEEILYASVMRPDLFKPPISEEIPIEEEIEVEEKKEKWRSRFPFKTATFIKSFLMMRAEKGKGAYPYEIYTAFKDAIYGTFKDEETRRMFIETGEIKLNGEAINGELTALIPESTIGLAKKGLKAKHPIYHVPTYQSFWKYFFILNVLDLIRRKGDKEPVPGAPITFKRQYYEIMPERIDDPAWNHPQEILYPLAWLGADKVKTMKEDHKEWLREQLPLEKLNPEEIEEKLEKLFWHYLPNFFLVDYPRTAKRIAEEKGITVEELKRLLLKREYITEKKKKELLERREEDLKASL